MAEVMGEERAENAKQFKNKLKEKLKEVRKLEETFKAAKEELDDEMKAFDDDNT
jgi:hypothetical protein